MELLKIEGPEEPYEESYDCVQKKPGGENWWKCL